MKKSGKILRGTAVIAGELLALSTAIFLLGSGDTERLLLAFLTLLLVLVPEIIERLFRCRINTALYIAAVLYALGPMMGHCWKFYYTIPFWDKLLHVCGGIAFVILGVFLFRLISGGKAQQIPSLVFALCFSMAIAVVWEFFEYGADVFLGMDMQADTVVKSINSYLLGPEKGLTRSICPIHSVMINDSPLPFEGYLDLGLHDTMLDMLLESLGAIITCVLLYFGKGEDVLIQPLPGKSGK